MLEKILAASSDPFWVAIVFLLSLAALHGLFVFWKPLSQRQWKLAEYIWLGLALVSVSGFVEEARYIKSSMAVEQSRGVAEQKLSAIEHWLDVYTEFACEKNGTSEKGVPLCVWLKVRASDFRLILDNEEFPPDLPANFLNGFDTVADAINASEKAAIRDMFSDYRNARQSYLTASQASLPSPLSSFLVSLAPMIFAIAVAIRFTKTTGEFRNLR